MLSREQEIQLLEQDIRDAERRLRSLEKAPIEGRWTRGAMEFLDAVANQQARIDRLGVELGYLRLADKLEEELA